MGYIFLNKIFIPLSQPNLIVKPLGFESITPKVGWHKKYISVIFRWGEQSQKCYVYIIYRYL